MFLWTASNSINLYVLLLPGTCFLIFLVNILSHKRPKANKCFLKKEKRNLLKNSNKKRSSKSDCLKVIKKFGSLKKKQFFGWRNYKICSLIVWQRIGSIIHVFCFFTKVKVTFLHLFVFLFLNIWIFYFLIFVWKKTFPFLCYVFHCLNLNQILIFVKLVSFSTPKSLFLIFAVHSAKTSTHCFIPGQLWCELCLKITKRFCSKRNFSSDKMWKFIIGKNWNFFQCWQSAGGCYIIVCISVL